MNVLHLSASHLNHAYSVNVTDFLGCMHTRRGEGNLLFEHGLAHVGVVYGQASRGKFKGIWSGWPVMLLSVGETVCHNEKGAMIFVENNSAAYKCSAFQPFSVSFKAMQCFTG